MSEPDKASEVEDTTAASRTGPPELTQNNPVGEESDKKENGVEAADERVKQKQKDEDAFMEDAEDVKGQEEEIKGVEEVKCEETKEHKGVEDVKDEEKECEGVDVESEEGTKSKSVKDVKCEEEKETKGGEGDVKVVEEKESKGEVGDVTVENAKEAKVGVEDVKVQEEKEGRGATEVVKGEEKESEGAMEHEEVVKMEEEAKETEVGNESEEVGGIFEESKEEKVTIKKRKRGQKPGWKREAKEKAGRKKEILRTPPSINRPVRERKTVERLVETLEKGPAKGLLIEKGRGTPLKDIPNVAYKLSKRKPDDIRLLHLILFGRKGKAINFKNHISQFSGFVWHENEEKQRTKVKEKLDKCVKDKLLDLCDVFNLPGSRATSRKEDLVAKLLDFMVAPYPTTDIILAEKEQLSRSRKRRRVLRGSSVRSSAGTPGKRSRKKRTKGEETPKSEEKSAQETEDEEEEDKDEEGEGEDEDENGLPDRDEEVKHSESEKENETDEDDHEDEEYDEHARKVKRRAKKPSTRGVSKAKKVTSPKEAPSPASAKNPSKVSSRHSRDEEANNAGEKVFSRKKKNDVTPKKKASTPRSDPKEKTISKKRGRGKAKGSEESGPSKEELRKTICEILKEVDFNTATFTDILQQLGRHFKMDLTPRKASIKLMIQDELTKLADEAEESDEDDDNEDEDAKKDEDPKTAAKEVKA